MHIKRKTKEIKRNNEYLARQEANATSIGLHIDANNKNRTDLKRKELETVDVTPKGVVIDAFDSLRVQHRVLTCR